MVPFLFNVMKETFGNLSVTDKKHLYEPRPFAPEWMLHTRIVYSIYQPLSGIQVTLAKDLAIVPHGQFFVDIKSGIARLDIPVRTVQPVNRLLRNVSSVQFVKFFNRELTSCLVPGVNFVLANQPS